MGLELLQFKQSKFHCRCKGKFKIQALTSCNTVRVQCVCIFFLILLQYPHWLDENKDKTDKAQLDKYLQQQTLVREICEEFESELPADTEERKKLRFERIVDLMQQVGIQDKIPLRQFLGIILSIHVLGCFCN